MLLATFHRGVGPIDAKSGDTTTDVREFDWDGIIAANTYYENRLAFDASSKKCSIPSWTRIAYSRMRRRSSE